MSNGQLFVDDWSDGQKGYDPPFPWFGGKRQVGEIVWKWFGKVDNFVDPFFGGGSSLFLRPRPFKGQETVNDLDGFVCNFWRSIRFDPEAVSAYADSPKLESDLHARHAWLVQRRDDLTPLLEGDPDYFDAKIAGWWVWGICSWIGGDWCSGKGPWQIIEGPAGCKLIKTEKDDGEGVRISRRRPDVTRSGHRGVKRRIPQCSGSGRGVHRKRPSVAGKGRGIVSSTKEQWLIDYLGELSDRLRDVWVCCGDWSRVVQPAVTTYNGLTAVFLDPPYGAEAKRDKNLYRKESLTVAEDVRKWAIENGNDPQLRIALCGYEDEHIEHMPKDWSMISWTPNGGMSNNAKGGNPNKTKERIWFSPNCICQNRQQTQVRLFD